MSYPKVAKRMLIAIWLVVGLIFAVGALAPRSHITHVLNATPGPWDHPRGGY